MRLENWGPDRLPDIEALWRTACPEETIGLDDLRTVLVDGGGSVVAEADGGGVVAFAQGPGEARHRGNIRLLAVHPERQRQGRGRLLLAAAETQLRGRGVREVRLAGGVPRYLWPGVDVLNTSAQALAEAAGYTSNGAEVNMAMPTSFRAENPRGVEVRRVGHSDAATVRDLIEAQWPIWLTEFDIAIRRGAVFAAWSDGCAIGFFAHSAMRSGWIGPMGTHPDFRARGVGAALLAAVCADLQRKGQSTAVVAWVGPVSYFAERGASVTRRFTRFVKYLV